MKRYLVLSLFLVGCSSDKDNSSAEATIFGTWESTCLAYNPDSENNETWYKNIDTYTDSDFEFKTQLYIDSNCEFESNECTYFPKILTGTYINIDSLDTTAGINVSQFRFSVDDYTTICEQEDVITGSTAGPYEYDQGIYIENNLLYKVVKEDGVGNVIQFEAPYTKID